MSVQRDREQQVVVTGVGIVSPIGIGVEPFWDGLRNRQSGIAPITYLPSSALPDHVGGEVKGFEAAKYTKTKDQKKQRSVSFNIHRPVSTTYTLSLCTNLSPFSPNMSSE